MQSIARNKVNQKNIWTKIKKVLKDKKTKHIDKVLYKEKVGFKLIDNNKDLYNELIAWITIYNDYRIKMQLFYTHSKQFIPLFKSINSNVKKIRNKVQIPDDIFIKVLGDFIYDHIGNFSYKQIIRLLSFDEVFTETKFDEIKFEKFNINLDEQRNYENIEYVQHALTQENEYFENQVNQIKGVLDIMTDLCETDFLRKTVLESLDQYLNKYYEHILSHIEQYFKSNRDSYL